MLLTATSTGPLVDPLVRQSGDFWHPSGFPLTKAVRGNNSELIQMASWSLAVGLYKAYLWKMETKVITVTSVGDAWVGLNLFLIYL